MDKETKKALGAQDKIQSNLMEYIEDVASSVDRVERKLDEVGSQLGKRIDGVEERMDRMEKKQDSALVHLEFLVKEMRRRREEETETKEVVKDFGSRLEKVELVLAA